MTNQVEVLRFKPFTRNNSSLRAFVDIQLGGVTINDCRIIQQDGQKAWLSMPQKEVPQPDGKKNYYPLVKLSERLEKIVNEIVIFKWQEFNQPKKESESAGISDHEIPF